MEVSAEAKRIMVVALGKLYSSRTQRGGLRLHRSLLLTLVMKSARDLYHEAQQAAAAWELQEEPAELSTGQDAELSTGQDAELSTGQDAELSTRQDAELSTGQDKEDKENLIPAQHSRKRRGKAAVEPDFLPCKKAKLDCPQQLIVNAVLLDYVNRSSGLGAPSPPPMPLQRAVAAC